MGESGRSRSFDPGFGGTLVPGPRPALLIVDFVRAYLDEASPLYAPVEPVRRVCVDLLGRARTAGIPVLHTNVVFTPGGVDGGVFYRKLPLLSVFDRGSPLGAFAEGLEPAPGEPVISKQYASAYFGTSLAATLTSLSLDTVIIAGLTTSGCIRATAVDTMQHGFVPVVVSDAVGDRDPGPHEANLYDLDAKYAAIATAAEVAGYLQGLADSA